MIIRNVPINRARALLLLLLVASAFVPLLGFFGGGVDSVTAATGGAGGSAVETIVQEPDGDWIKIRIAGPSDFYYKLYSNQMNVHNPRDTWLKAILGTRTNETGYWKVYIDKAQRFASVTIKPILRKSKGNLRADLVALNISGQFASVYVKGSVGLSELKGSWFGKVWYTDKLGVLQANSNVVTLIAGSVENGFISSLAGGFREIRVTSNMVDTLIWTGINRFGATPAVAGGCDIKRLSVGGSIRGSHLYLAPASFGDNFEQPTSHLGELRIGTRRAPGLIENTDIVSSNGVGRIKAQIGTNVTVNGVIMPGGA